MTTYVKRSIMTIIAVLVALCLVVPAFSEVPLTINKTAPKYTTHNQEDIDVVGTHLTGEICMTYHSLVVLFGEPDRLEDDKDVDVEWRIKSINGDVVTIYNYQDGINYCKEDDSVCDHVEVTDITMWNVGSKTQESSLFLYPIINTLSEINRIIHKDQNTLLISFDYSRMYLVIQHSDYDFTDTGCMLAGRLYYALCSVANGSLILGIKGKAITRINPMDIIYANRLNDLEGAPAAETKEWYDADQERINNILNLR